MDVIGGSREERIPDPWRVLGEYDLVFARARCATEALAVGTSVVVCGREGIGPLVTTRNLEETHRMNFGADLLTRPVTPAGVGERLDQYDANDAAAVSRRIRQDVGLDRVAATHLALYEAAIEERAHAQGELSTPAMMKAVFDRDARLLADYVERLDRHHRRVLDDTSLKLRDERDESRKWADKLLANRTTLTSRVSEMAAELRQVRDAMAQAEAERDRAHARVRAIQESRLFRLQTWLGGIRARLGRRPK